jgi:DNA-binding NarL/FixJ family response regulator
MEPISIVLADSHYLSRLGLKHLIDGQTALKVTGEAENEGELREILKKIQPKIVIMDYHQPGYFDIDSVAIIHQLCPKANTLLISGDNNKENIFRVLEHNVQSFLTKTCGEEEILDAIKATGRGEKFFCTKIIDYLLEKSFSKEEEDCSPSPLTPREIEIVQLIARGLIAKEIAGLLNLSTHTVYTHRKNIMRKLKLNTSSELVLYAVNNGIVEN